MAGVWADLQLVFIIIFFIFLLKWTTDQVNSKVIGFILAVVIAYLTFYTHIEILILVLIFFFGFPFFSKVAEGFNGGGK
jgi:chromate transport protein ChrA